MSRKILTQAIQKWGEIAQVEMLNEEAIELALAARKWIRKRSEAEFDNLAEEIADVSILIEQMTILYPKLPEKIAQYRTFKLDRLQRRIDESNFEGE
ncbi:hypothetical protein KO02_12105 [Sphingobacterium sp. ML3W]|uniref:hypothetical protein n=1 Tax=Sphingobacterium sp. ML3W TaxID=1538644 RepID=UPI0004F5E81F|nr:hypothetical protein [Sphingobacterium sp. ML3W]AIM37353.1 hypothetical protein KO02_12105 [Sphingobacterium sp. ML3W]